jgi:hypothetical protein
MIKAIETHYKGCRFRSRLEARWAVFFDALGIVWEYEAQGYHVSSMFEGGGEWLYLPDFHLPALGTFVEVKGTLDGLTADYFNMIANAIDWGGALPGVSDSYATTRGLLWLGPVPFSPTGERPGHVIIQHSKGGWCRCTHFIPGGMATSCELGSKTEHYFDATGDAGEPIREVLRECVYNGSDFPWQFFGQQMEPEVAAAYRAARSARFEHGEKG